MSDASAVEASLYAEAVRAGVPARPVVVDTGWDVGPVAAFLMPDEPVTLIDCGTGTSTTRARLEAAFDGCGRRVSELRRIIVTHAHNDHIGCARHLQEVSGCEVLVHAEDVTRLSAPAAAAADRAQMLRSLGVPAADPVQKPPREGRSGLQLTPLTGGEVVEAGGTRLRIEHRPGHTPGHVWVAHEPSGALFVGDYLLASAPTNAGLEPDPTSSTGRLPMMRLYHEGLAEMAERDAPVVLPGHGPPITRHRELIGRRLDKTNRRTEHVLRVLARSGEVTPYELTVKMFGERLRRSLFEYLADVTGRLDLLLDQEDARARVIDGVWHFAASSPEGRGLDVELAALEGNRSAERGGLDA